MASYYHLLDRASNEQGVITATYTPTVHAQGAWNTHEQHLAAASGVLAHELERFVPHDQMRIARISYDIFGLINFDEFTITTRTIRPGRTIELIEATMESNHRTCIVARAWRLCTQDTRSIAGLEDQAIAHPENFPEWHDLKRWPGGFIQTLETRADDSRKVGSGIVWLNNSLQMVQGETTSDFVHIVGMVDTANGIVPRQEGDFNWSFANVDLQIHMHRLPKGKWLGLETVQQYGEDGIGLTSSVLHDVYGPFGRSEQILTLRQL